MPLKHTLDRRGFMEKSSALALGATALATIGTPSSFAETTPAHQNQADPLFKISLAEWSLHRTLHSKKITNLDFPKVAAEEFGINAIEYVNSFFKSEVDDPKYMKQLKQRCEDHDVTSLLIMVDGEGHLGDPNETKRKKAVENHHRWLHAANYLGCHSIRVNAASSGSWDEQVGRAADGLAQLSTLATGHGLNVIVENHGGLSSNGDWLSQVIKKVDMSNCGTLPDFGNFRIKNNEWYDRYKGVTELMPFAKAVSAKSNVFDENGNESQTDFLKMMKIVLDAGYRGHVGIEWEGGKPDEYTGIKMTRDLLVKCRAELADSYK